jgi:hypothetical protein
VVLVLNFLADVGGVLDDPENKKYSAKLLLSSAGAIYIQ